MTTRSDSAERLSQDPETSRNGFSQDSLKVVSSPPLENDSVGEMISSKKEVKSSPLASLLEKDEEETILSDSAEASFPKEPETKDGVISSVPETTSAFLEEDEELQRVKETSAASIYEVGTASDVHIIEKNGKQPQKMERVRVKDNAFVGRSVNIDLVDDTALLNVVPFRKKGKDAPRKHKRNGGDELRIVYSINEMKSMRYAHSASQKKLWSDVYARLVPEMVNEYEGLVSLKNQRTAKPNMRESGIGPVSAVPRRNRVNIFVH